MRPDCQPSCLPPPSELYGLSPGERLALWVFRCALPGTTGCAAAAPRCRSEWARDLQAVVAAFHAAHAHMVREQGSTFRIAAAGTLSLTRDERRLLRAIAAAQAEDEDVLDHHLFRLAPNRKVRPHLARAVVELAAALATAGHWLSSLPRVQPLPAPALSVARLRGRFPGQAEIAWPAPGQRAWLS